MLNYKDDFKATKLLLLKNIRRNNYDRIYFSSNEELDDIFSNFDFKNKDVLSVIGSGDQAISFHNNQVNKLDLFDINKLAIYYYYLRVWAIKYLDDIYPNIDGFNNYIKELLNKVEINSENELNAYNYWKKVSHNISEFYVKQLFYYCNFPLNGENIDLSLVNKSLNNSFSNIFNIDISEEIDIDNKYDFIYTSNIVDYVSGVRKINLFRDNLASLLKENGIVICTNLGAYFINSDIKNSFEEKFEFRRMPEVKTWGTTIPGHYYVKR